MKVIKIIAWILLFVALLLFVLALFTGNYLLSAIVSALEIILVFAINCANKKAEKQTNY